MDNWAAVSILLDVLNRALACNLDPAGVKLSLEEIRTDCAVDVVKTVLAVRHLDELEVVVVVCHHDTVLLAALADLNELLEVVLKLRSARAILFAEVWDSDVLNADCDVLGNSAL